MRQIIPHPTRLVLLAIFLLSAFGVEASTPTLVQHVSCPNSRNTGNQQSNTPVYTCPLPEPSQAGDAIIVGVVVANSGSFSMTDDQSNTWNLIDSVVDGNGAYVAIYLALDVHANTHILSFHRTVPASNLAMSA